jgi:hypothetical protein
VENGEILISVGKREGNLKILLENTLEPVFMLNPLQCSDRAGINICREK